MKFDVIIAHKITGLVVSTADFNRSESDARYLAIRLNDGNLHDHLIAVPCEEGSVFPGAVIEVEDGYIESILKSRPMSKGENQLAIYYNRKANGVCVVCESPNLETTTRCPACAQKNREASARSDANSL